MFQIISVTVKYRKLVMLMRSPRHSGHLPIVNDHLHGDIPLHCLPGHSRHIVTW